MIVWEKSDKSTFFQKEKGRNRFQAEFSLDGLAWNDNATKVLFYMIEVYIDIIKECMITGKDSGGKQRYSYNAESPADVGFPRDLNWKEYQDIVNRILNNNFKVHRNNKAMIGFVKKIRKHYTFRGKKYYITSMETPPIQSRLLYDNITFRVYGRKRKGMVRVMVPKQRTWVVFRRNMLQLSGEPLKKYQEAFKQYLKYSVIVQKHKAKKMQCGDITLPDTTIISETLLQEVMETIRKKLAKKLMKTVGVRI